MPPSSTLISWWQSHECERATHNHPHTDTSRVTPHPLWNRKSFAVSIRSGTPRQKRWFQSGNQHTHARTHPSHPYLSTSSLRLCLSASAVTPSVHLPSLHLPLPSPVNNRGPRVSYWPHSIKHVTTVEQGWEMVCSLL